MHTNPNSQEEAKPKPAPQTDPTVAGPEGEAPANPQPSTNNPQPPFRSRHFDPRPSPDNPQRRDAGRPSLLTDELLDQICTHIAEEGLSDSAAGRRCFVPTSTLSRWKHEEPIVADVLAMAREQFRSNRLQVIRSAKTRDGRQDWRAAAWELARVFPEDYAHRPGARVEHHNTNLPTRAELQHFIASANRVDESNIKLTQAQRELLAAQNRENERVHRRVYEAIQALRELYNQACLYAMAANEAIPDLPPFLVEFQNAKAPLPGQAYYPPEPPRRAEVASPSPSSSSSSSPSPAPSNPPRSEPNSPTQTAPSSSSTPPQTEPKSPAPKPNPPSPQNTPIQSQNSRNSQPPADLTNPPPQPATSAIPSAKPATPSKEAPNPPAPVIPQNRGPVPTITRQVRIPGTSVWTTERIPLYPNPPPQ